MEFSRHEYWSELPFPSPGDLPDPGIESGDQISPALAGRFFTTSITIISDWDCPKQEIFKLIIKNKKNSGFSYNVDANVAMVLVGGDLRRQAWAFFAINHSNPPLAQAGSTIYTCLVSIFSSCTVI